MQLHWVTTTVEPLEGREFQWIVEILSLFIYVFAPTCGVRDATVLLIHPVPSSLRLSPLFALAWLLMAMLSVLAMDNVVGREYAYINATMRNRRAFIITLHEVCPIRTTYGVCVPQ